MNDSSSLSSTQRGLVQARLAREPLGKKEVRIFVSSSFRDMQEERDELVKRVFPRLRKICQKRGVAWSEVDLRWGITDEQKAEGKVLPICLAEIERCRPYFIGLLGERYGWIPEEIPQALVEQEPWLAEHRTRSVTELEILHGVLLNPQMAQQSFFYFRDPSFAESVPPDQAHDYLELPTEEDIANWGYDAAVRRAEERKQKLAELKQQIRESGLPVRENYPNPHALGEIVLEDLTRLIDQVFPETTPADPYETEIAVHEAFALNETRVYVKRKRYFEQLDAFLEGDGPPLVLVGDSGVGKTALLANWALRCDETHPEIPMLMHFVGASGPSTSWFTIAINLAIELELNFGVGHEILDSFYETMLGDFQELLSNCLKKAADKGRMLIILDGLNLLDDQFGALDLEWLPTDIPSNTRLILSTVEGRPLDELKRRGWPTLEVTALNIRERRRLISEYLAQYTKTLSAERSERVAAARQTGNPLYLRVLLEELRVYGDHFTLDGKIEHYLSARTIEELYERILERFEKDFEQDRPGLVRDAMSLMWASAMGLYERDLLELLGTTAGPLPQQVWSPFYLAAESLLVSHGGALACRNEYAQQAVYHRYLSDEAERKSVLLKIADHITFGEGGNWDLIDLMSPLARAGAWERLAKFLGNPPIKVHEWKQFVDDVKKYWRLVEANSTLRMLDYYQPIIATPYDYPHHVIAVEHMLTEAGNLEEAALLRANFMRGREDSDFLREVAIATGEIPHHGAGSVYVSVPHPATNAERAAELNIRYQQDLARWKALPWWKRVRTKKPDRPTGI
ncbi:MAG TPA: DUF4062 domain-containing protein [Blastocatellia bacterium]|nr:DUF4062 domain-containing protein [Blastocatellia bacterium]